jgi:photosystem II stability/assembly factor-like uncharacterized protein
MPDGRLARLSLLGALLLALGRPASSQPQGADAPSGERALLRGMEWRSIGPFRGGRSVAVAGVPSQPQVYYFGGTGGGVWKTTNGGHSWQPVSDGWLGTGSVGALAVAESDPNVVYVGMGEACIRGNVSHGDGVYRSSDAGKTWKHVGLRDTRQIGKLRVHPRDPELVYVAALGHAFGANAERGVFRSKDGGASWQKVLYVDDKTGAVDLAMDPGNPRVLYAGFWQVVRKPWTFESGGPGSALYKSSDGGDTWRKLDGGGLPKGPWGRIGVAVSPARPERVWALVEAEEGGVFRSDDAGLTWRKLNDERKLRQRAWYYTHIYADTSNPDVVYVLNVDFFRSADGGKSFARVRTPHGDNHDLWIAPGDSSRMIGADDGGAHVSFDGGASWSRQDNQPTAQFYHVVTDNAFPYRVYGAQQDNSTVAIASRSAGAGIQRTDWYDVGGCESGYIAPHPKDPAIVYAGCYGGVLTRYDHRTGATKEVSVYPDNPMGAGAEAMRYRFQWTFPIVFSPHDPGTLYVAGNRVFKSTSEGQSWQPISPDLTRNDPSKLGPSGGPITKDNTSVEYYGTVFAFAESPLEKGLLWAGSDDGLVHVSRDGGASWTNVTPREMPEWSMVSQIDASPHDPAKAYLAVNRYKLDDNRPLVYVTGDYGRTWHKASAGLPEDSFVRVVREDPVRRGLLFAGTETGVHYSLDDGARWRPLRLDWTEKDGAKPDEVRAGLPVVPITDLVVKDGDLVVSTQGRAFWILDDLTPLRLAEPAAGTAPRLFKPRAAHRFLGGSAARPGLGRNPPSGATVYYTLAAAPKEGEEVTLEFLDSQGALLRKFSSKPAEDEPEAGEDGRRGGGTPKLPALAGLNRFAWDLRHEGATRVKGMILWSGRVEGPVVLPGTYQVRLNAGGRSLSESFEVKADPRLSVSLAELEKQHDLLLKIRDKVSAAHAAILKLRTAREQVDAVVARVKTGGGNPAIAEAAESFKKKLTEVEEELYQTRNKSEQDPLNYPIRLNDKLGHLAGVVGSAEGAPTEQAHAVWRDLSARVDAQLSRFEQALAEDLPAFNRLVQEQSVPAVALEP